MKIKKYRPFYFPHSEEHAQWLAAMARQGWRYKGQDFIGFQQFEQGAPAEMAFSWDQAPRARENVLAYRQKCSAAGWEVAATAGRWYCWSKPMVPGRPLEPLRDKASTIAMLLDIQRQYSSQFMLMAALLFLQLPALSGKGRPFWLTIVVIAIMALAAAINIRGAFAAKARVRQLDPGQR